MAYDKFDKSKCINQLRRITAAHKPSSASTAATGIAAFQPIASIVRGIMGFSESARWFEWSRCEQGVPLKPRAGILSRG
jgi:hypothetical protein